jgi:hypothetical protein
MATSQKPGGAPNLWYDALLYRLGHRDTKTSSGIGMSIKHSLMSVTQASRIRKLLISGL